MSRPVTRERVADDSTVASMPITPFEALTPEERICETERRALRSHRRASWDTFRHDWVGMACLALVVMLALVVGFVVGASSGYLGGRVDAVASFVIQAFSSFPFLLFALVVMYALGPGLQNLYVALGLLMWTGTARLVRGEVMRLKSSEYVLACVVAGGSPWRVIVRHLLPNCLPLLVVTATLGIPNAILCEATLSFLGLGVQPPMASWGQMIAAAQPFVQSSTYYSLVPGAAIFITVMAFNLLGDAASDAIDPRGRAGS